MKKFFGNGYHKSDQDSMMLSFGAADGPSGHVNLDCSKKIAAPAGLASTS